jgi:DNA-binding SARP family transcriptional activator/tetratricopeptide (TPR) repeat protein
LEYRVLGPLAVLADGKPIDIGSTRQRIVLAAMLLDANRVVSRDRLVDALWDRHPPATASSQIHICVSALRRKLAAHGAPDVIETVPPGYLIRVDDHALDAREFELLVASGRAAAADGRPHDAVRHLLASLELWRGPAFAGLKSDLVQVAATRLNEERLGVLEDRMDAELELGRHHDIVGELSELVAGNPLRERMCGQLMLALYRDGRQAEALAAFRAARAIFLDELGLEPSQGLRDLEHAMLQNDPALQPGSLTRSRRPSVAAALIPRQLPADVGDFVARQGVLGQVRAILAPQPPPAPSLRHLEIVVLSGRSGVGKTALALHAAHELSDSYPDGQLYAQLEAGTEPVSTAHVLEEFLRALGVTLVAPPGSVEDLAHTYRSQLARRSVLVVLDAAASVGQVIPLLPGGSSCAVIITSRSRLPGLPGAQRFEVGVFDESAGVELVTRVIGEERVCHEKDAARKLVRLCGGLPVALRIAAAKLAARPHWTVGRLVSRLEDEQQRLDELEFDEHVRGEAGGIRASISLSYESLGPDARRLLRRLAILGATDFAYWIGAPLLDLDIAIVTDLTEQLVAARLIDAIVLEDQSVRFQIHELIRVYALERLMAEEPATERAAALRRVLGCWLFLAGEAHRREYGGDFTVLHGNAERWTLSGDAVSELLRDPLSWFRRERSALLLAIIKAAQAGLDELCWDLAMTSSTHFESGSFLDDWRQSCDSALDAVRRKGNRLGEAALLCSLGGLALAEQDLDEAVRCLLPAMRLFSQLQDTHGWALAARHLAYVDRQRGHYDQALSRYEEALRGLRSVGDRIAEAHVLNNMAQIYLDKRRQQPAEGLLNQALDICRSVNARRGAAQVEHRLGELRLSKGDLIGAEESFESVLRAVVAGNDLVGQAYALYGLGAVRMGSKLYSRAEADLRAALEVSASCGDRLIHGRILLALAELYETTQRPAPAAEQLSEALEVFREVGSALWQARALAASGRLYEAAGRPDAAAAAWQEGLNLLGEADAGLRDTLSAALAKLAPR